MFSMTDKQKVQTNFFFILDNKLISSNADTIHNTLLNILVNDS